MSTEDRSVGAAGTPRRSTGVCRRSGGERCSEQFRTAGQELAAKPVAGKAAVPAAPPKFSEVWQVPVLVLGVLMLVGAVMSVVSQRPKPDFTKILGEIQGVVDEQRYEDALEELNRRVLPYLEQPAVTADNRRQFHTLVARTIYLWQQAATTKHAENYRAWWTSTSVRSGSLRSFRRRTRRIW